MKNISVVVPVFNEEGSVEELARKIQISSEKHSFDYEIIFINDGSTDGTKHVIDTLCSENKNILSIHFRHNKGKADALQAGFSLAKNEYIITMDGDLQDDPEEIPQLISKIDEGWDVVSGWKKIRHDPVNKTLPSKFWNKAIRFLTGINIHDFNCGL